MIWRNFFSARAREFLVFPHCAVHTVFDKLSEAFIKNSSNQVISRIFCTDDDYTEKIAETSVIYVVSLKEMYFRKYCWGKKWVLQYASWRMQHPILPSHQLRNSRIHYLWEDFWAMRISVGCKCILQKTNCSLEMTNHRFLV